MNINSEYKTNAFYNIIGGFDFKLASFIRPEIKIGYVLGSTDSQINSNSSIESIFERNTTALYIGITSKIIIGQNENYYFQILPQYSFGKLTASGSYFENDENLIVIFSKNQKISEFKNFFGFGFGIHIFLTENHKNAIDFNIYYQGINFENLLSKLEYNNNEINTKNSIGFGVNCFF